MPSLPAELVPLGLMYCLSVLTRPYYFPIALIGARVVDRRRKRTKVLALTGPCGYWHVHLTCTLTFWYPGGVGTSMHADSYGYTC